MQISYCIRIGIPPFKVVSALPTEHSPSFQAWSSLPKYRWIASVPQIQITNLCSHILYHGQECFCHYTKMSCFEVVFSYQISILSYDEIRIVLTFLTSLHHERLMKREIGDNILFCFFNLGDY